MLRKKAVILIGLLALVLVTQGMALAAFVPIINPSFEADSPPSGGSTPWVIYQNHYAYNGSISGWSQSAPVVITTMIPTIPGTIFDNLPDGSHFATDNGGTIYQTLSSNLLPGDYTLTVYVGHRKDVGFLGYTVALYAGGNELVSDSSLTPGRGQWLADTLNYHATAGSPGIGQPIQIRLVSNGIQADFDNVSLEYSSPVPITGSMLLLGSGLAGLMIFRRKRIVS